MRTILYPLTVGLALVPVVARGDEIHDAAKNGDIATVKHLLAINPELVRATERDQTPLHYAAENGQDEVVLLLLAHGARIDEAMPSGCTALHMAARAGKPRTVGLLLSRGAKINATAGNGFLTPLHCAVISGRDCVVEVLLCHGADLNAWSAIGTPLKLAVERNKTDIADVLRRAGARNNLVRHRK
jgi:ankyrin repeat protein